MHDRYLLLHLPPEAWLIDLVGAHERILYEKHRQGTPASPQGLLFPVSAPATPLQLARLAELLPELNAQGIHIELREGREAVLHAIPAGLPPSAGTPLLDFLLEIAQTEALPPDWREGLARHIARHGVPRPPYTLTPEAVETPWNALCACEEPNYTPAGHRIRFYLSPEALEKLFT
jgi:DNA mismatch repair protein MutL